MSALTAILAGTAAFAKALADAGTTLPDLATAVETAMGDLEAAAAGGLEATVRDALEAVVPQLKLFVATADAIRALPGFAAADVDSPVRRATDESPYSGNPTGIDDDDE